MSNTTRTLVTILGYCLQFDRGQCWPVNLRKPFRVEHLEPRMMLTCDTSTHPSGDLDRDGDVDGNDFLSWQRTANTSTPTQAQSDLAAWESDFGNSSVTPNPGHSHHPPNPAAMALVSLDQATHTVVASGNWSDPNVWQNGTHPTAGARVVIPAGMTLTVDSRIAEELKTIRIDGTLQFATDVNTELRVDTIVSSPMGCFVMGTASNPIAVDVTARVVFADDGAIDRSVDPNLLSRGAILQGNTTIYGTTKTAWTTLAQQPTTGATQLVLSEAPQGWRPGDELVVAGTDPNDPASDEVVQIASITGSTVTLSSALTKDHVAPQAGLDVHVANNTRNVVFTSENSDVTRRGHVMFMHTLDVDVNYAAFEKLGRTDKSIPLNDTEWPDLEPNNFVDLGGSNVRGRYSLHFHRGGTNPNSTPGKVHGSVVNDDPGWAYVNHSSNVDFTSNVSYNILGAAYNTEAGDEIGSFINNIAIRTVNPADPLNNLEGDNRFINAPDGREKRGDFGWQGDGFWFHGPHVTVQGNVVSGASGHAYIWWPEGLLERDTQGTFFDSANLPNGHLLGPPGTQVQIYDVPILSFDNNLAYSATRGIQFYYLHTDFFGGGESFIEEEAPLFTYRSQLNSTISNSTVWNTSQAAFAAPYASRLTIDGLKLVGTGAAGSVGMDLGHFFNQARFSLNNLDIQGFETGLITPLGGNATINGGTYANTTDLLIKNPERSPRRLTINNINFANLPSSLSGQEGNRQNIRLQANFDEFGPDDSDKHPLFHFLPDQILLNYGPYQNQQLYFSQQAANFVPVSPDNPAGGSGRTVPPQYVGQSNGLLASQFNLAFGGALLPNDAVLANGIDGGLVGSVSMRMSVPPSIAEDGEILPPLPDVPPLAASSIIAPAASGMASVTAPAPAPLTSSRNPAIVAEEQFPLPTTYTPMQPVAAVLSPGSDEPSHPAASVRVEPKEGYFGDYRMRFHDRLFSETENQPPLPDSARDGDRNARRPDRDEGDYRESRRWQLVDAVFAKLQEQFV
ncbi:MAG: G8 domain-containing protein [Pseudomonadota bacterium]